MNGQTVDHSESGRDAAADPAVEAKQRLRSRQRFWPALGVGIAAMLAGSLLWAVITSLTGLQIGVLSIGIGFLVGFSIRAVGKAVDRSYGVMGGALTLVGTIIGSMLAISVAIAGQGAEGVMSFWAKLEPFMLARLLQMSVRFPDVLFYLVATYIGYKFSFKEYTEEQLEQLGENSK